MPANCKITFNKLLSEQFNLAANKLTLEDNTFYQTRIEDASPFVFLFTVNIKDVVIPPHPFLPNGLTVKGRQTNERYSFILSLPKYADIVLFYPDNVIAKREVYGISLAKDIIHPESIDKTGMSMDRNLFAQGLFYSLSNPPETSDVISAEGQLRDYYTKLLERAQWKYWDNKKCAVPEEMRSEVEYAMAVLELDQTFWDRRQSGRDRRRTERRKS